MRTIASFPAAGRSDVESSRRFVLPPPILWLFLGPPAFRFEEHGALESLALSFDAWNVVRALWWIAFGYVALANVYSRRRELRSILASLGALPWLVAAWLASLFASTVASPSPVFTFANASFITILVITALDLSIRLHDGTVTLRNTLRWLFRFAVLLLAVFCVAFLVDPSLVGSDGALTDRVRGGQVLELALTAQVAFFTGIYLSYKSPRGSTLHYLLVAAFSPTFVVMAQTRAMFAGFVAASLIFVATWLARTDRRAALQALSVAALVGATAFSFIAYDELTPRGSATASVERLVVRDAATLEGLNGRAGLAAILLDRVAGEPFGLGFSAGPRHVLLTAPMDELRRHGIFVRFAGNAHNIHLEIFGGAGYAGFAAWLAMLAWIVYHAWKIRGAEAAPIRALVVLLMLHGITESTGVLPFFQSSVLLWVITAWATTSRAAAVRRAAETNVGQHGRPYGL